MSLYFYPAPPDTLQLDLDTKSSREIFKRQLKLLRKLPLNFRILKVKKYISRTGNQHICIQTSKHYVIHGTNTLASIARFRPEKRD
jgi:hypothetical protein